MVMTGPQKYPPASTSYWYQGRYPGDRMESNVGVMHTTEGTSLPSYGGGAVAPNFTAVPDLAGKKLRWYQHFDFDVSSRALVNLSGGVQTNTLNCVQIELVGTCDPGTHRSWGSTPHIFWPEAPDWALLEVAKFVRWASDNHGLKMQSTVTWKAYPGSYGAANGVRLSGAQWGAYYGWLGHQHVPENLHGDPGAFPMAKVLTFAKNKSWETDMAITKADVKAIFTTDDVIGVPTTWSPGNSYWTAASLLVDSGKRLRSIEAKLAAQSVAIRELAVALAAHNQEVDVDALVARIETAIEGITVHLDVPATGTP